MLSLDARHARAGRVEQDTVKRGLPKPLDSMRPIKDEAPHHVTQPQLPHKPVELRQPRRGAIACEHVTPTTRIRGGRLQHERRDVGGFASWCRTEIDHTLPWLGREHVGGDGRREVLKQQGAGQHPIERRALVQPSLHPDDHTARRSRPLLSVSTEEGGTADCRLAVTHVQCALAERHPL